MKRTSSRSTSSRRTKKSRCSIKSYNDESCSEYSVSPERSDNSITAERSDESITTGRIRRRSSRGRSPHGPRTYGDNREPYGRTADEVRNSDYNVLCVSDLHPKASNELVKDTIYREYKRFGDFSIKISHDRDQKRVAHVCFRNWEDARNAKHHKPRIVIYDKVAIVEPVLESRSNGVASEIYRDRGRSRSLTPDYDYYYKTRSPLSGRYPLEHYERAFYGPLGAPPHEYRQDGPLPAHSDYFHTPLPRDVQMHHPYSHVHSRISAHHSHFPPPLHELSRPPHNSGAPESSQNENMHEGNQDGKEDSSHNENRKSKFPNYLHHIPPEDDPLATRTLFAGNLEFYISEPELRRIFERYGVVEDIDIKRPRPGTGNAFAFVRFQNLDMAHRCKVKLSGQYIGKFQCKIGYGKATPTTRIWVGGLGHWTSVEQLEKEFDRFGAIKKIDYMDGCSCAYIQYDSIDAAQAALKEMRGFPLGGKEHRLRVDFADASATPVLQPTPNFPPLEKAHAPRTPLDYNSYDARAYERWAAYMYGDPAYDFPGYEHWADYAYRSYRERDHGYPFYDHRDPYRAGYSGEQFRSESEWVNRRSELEYKKHQRSPSNEQGVKKNSTPHSPRIPSLVKDSTPINCSNKHLDSVQSVADMAYKCTETLEGALILKNSLFPAKFHLTEGEEGILKNVLRDDGKYLLRITQRLRLEPHKLEDVTKKISSSNSHAIFLGLSASSTDIVIEEVSVQTRPLKNLVSYLKQKEAAGVASLPVKESETAGVVYAFPPCSFSDELIQRTTPGLSEEGLKEDYIVVVVVKDSAS